MGIPNSGYPVLLNMVGAIWPSTNALNIFLPGQQTPYILAPWEQLTIVSLNLVTDASTGAGGVIVTSLPPNIPVTLPNPSSILTVVGINEGFSDNGAWSISAPTGITPSVTLIPAVETVSSWDASTTYIAGTGIITSTTGSTVRPTWEARLTNNPSGKF
jgi:hypothetical protein